MHMEEESRTTCWWDISTSKHNYSSEIYFSL